MFPWNCSVFGIILIVVTFILKLLALIIGSFMLPHTASSVGRAYSRNILCSIGTSSRIFTCWSRGFFKNEFSQGKLIIAGGSMFINWQLCLIIGYKSWYGSDQGKLIIVGGSMFIHWWLCLIIDYESRYGSIGVLDLRVINDLKN